MNRICIICARGGSKGVKNKNIKLLLDKPLIAHSIIQAKSTGQFDCIAVSSDSKAILEVAKQYGADYIINRPKELASDTAAKLPVMQHCVREVENISGIQFDTIIDLDATSPLRTVSDIINCIEKIESNHQANNLVTAAPSRRSPYFNLIEENEQGFVGLSKSLPNHVVRRQDAPKAYDMNASIYAWRRENFLNAEKVITDKTILYTMPEERSYDIDSELDFEIVTLLAQKRGELL